jgi:RNA polymerase sigma factor (sigma-70 family)
VIQRDELIRWWANIEPVLARFARSYGLGIENAQDVVQNVAVLVLKQYSKAASDPEKAYSQFVDEGEFKRWVYARLHWIMLDQIRSTKPILEPLDFAPERSVSPNQEEALIVKDILSLVEELPTNQRIVLRGLIKGRSREEIARELHVKEATIRSLQRYARLKLAALLAKQEGRK